MINKLFINDPYLKEFTATIVDVQPDGIILDRTAFYAEAGGQIGDTGTINNQRVTDTKYLDKEKTKILHKITNPNFKIDEKVEGKIDWERRWKLMRLHSALHLVGVLFWQIYGKDVKIIGSNVSDGKSRVDLSFFNPIDIQKIFEETNNIVSQNLPIKRYSDKEKEGYYWWEINEKLKVPCGGTHVKTTGEIGKIKLQIKSLGKQGQRIYCYLDENSTDISNSGVETRNCASLHEKQNTQQKIILSSKSSIILNQFKNELSKINTALNHENLRIKYLGGNGIISREMQELKTLDKNLRPQKGKELNELKTQIEQLFSEAKNKLNYSNKNNEQIDYTKPGIKPEVGNLHLVTEAINEITKIFERIGFTRVRHPEIDSDYFAFESLNMPKDHPARDEWETFFIEKSEDPSVASRPQDDIRVVLTPQTSNGQVREMLKKELPIRMINIAKCYRRQSDISHVPMFHQFEGLYVDKNVSIKHLIGVIDYFGKQFFGKGTKSRIRPFHFQFTEPSFEVDFSCSACGGIGCRLCKEGWLELGGAGMVHPNVLKVGGIDPEIYSGFAFGWGVERTYMIKTGIVGDVRTMYTTDLRLLKQF